MVEMKVQMMSFGLIGMMLMAASPVQSVPMDTTIPDRCEYVEQEDCDPLVPPLVEAVSIDGPSITIPDGACTGHWKPESESGVAAEPTGDGLQLVQSNVVPLLPSGSVLGYPTRTIPAPSPWIGFGITVLNLVRSIDLPDEGPSIPDWGWYVVCSGTLQITAECEGAFAVEARECLVQARETIDSPWVDAPAGRCTYNDYYYQPPGHPADPAPLPQVKTNPPSYCEVTHDGDLYPGGGESREDTGVFKQDHQTQQEIARTANLCLDAHTTSILNRPQADEWESGDYIDAGHERWKLAHETCASVSVDWDDLSWEEERDGGPCPHEGGGRQVIVDTHTWDVMAGDITTESRRLANVCVSGEFETPGLGRTGDMF